jgi:hypothetical protein
MSNATTPTNATSEFMTSKPEQQTPEPAPVAVNPTDSKLT